MSDWWFWHAGITICFNWFNFWRKTRWAYYKSRGWALINSRHVWQDFVSLKNCVDHKSCASNYNLSSLFLRFLSLFLTQNISMFRLCCWAVIYQLHCIGYKYTSFSTSINVCFQCSPTWNRVALRSGISIS